MHIPFPEDLPGDVWAEKWQQLQWLSRQGLLGTKSIDGLL